MTRYLTPARTGALAYVLTAAVVQAWTGLVIVALVGAAVELHRHHHRAGERRAALLPGGSGLSPSRGLVALVIGAVVILRDGLGRSIVTTLAAGLAVLVVALVAFGEVVIAGRFVPVLVSLVVALIVAVATATLAVRGARNRTRHHLITAATLEEFRALTPGAFEVAVSHVFNARGWRLRVVGGAGDEGADLLGADPDGRRVIVQCKRNGPALLVGSPVIQLAIGARTIHGAERVVVVTTSGYSAPARDLAARHGVELVAGSDLVTLARRAPAMHAPRAHPRISRRATETPRMALPYPEPLSTPVRRTRRAEDRSWRRRPDDGSP